MGARAALALVLLVVPAIMAADGNIQFWRDEITLTCPKEGTWFIKEEGTNSTKKHIMKYDGKISKPYYCKYDDIKYYFYVKGKTCQNCFELDGSVFLLIIVVDVILTAAVMMIVYKCTKKKVSAGSTHPKTPSRSGPAPPTPSRDYEQLNIHTRSQDTYSIVNRTG